MKNSHGFSLVEVLVVIAFIGIMTGVLFVSLSGKRTETSLKSAAREVAAAVRTAQNSALTGVKTGVPDGRSLCRYEIKNTNASRYEILLHYSNGGNCNRQSSLGVFSLKNGVSFSGGNAKAHYSTELYIFRAFGYNQCSKRKGGLEWEMRSGAAHRPGADAAHQPAGGPVHAVPARTAERRK